MNCQRDHVVKQVSSIDTMAVNFRPNDFLLFILVLVLCDQIYVILCRFVLMKSLHNQNSFAYGFLSFCFHSMITLFFMRSNRCTSFKQHASKEKDESENNHYSTTRLPSFIFLLSSAPTNTQTHKYAHMYMHITSFSPFTHSARNVYFSNFLALIHR